MKTLKILVIAEVFFKTLSILIILCILFLFFVLVHSEHSPESYNKVTMELTRGLAFNYNPMAPLPPNSFVEHKERNNNLIYFNKIDFSSKFKILFRILVFAGLSLLILKEFLNFIKSVKKYSSFFLKNYIHFYRIGIYHIFILIYSLYTGYIGWTIAMKFPDGYAYFINRHHYNLHTYLTICAFIILSFVASQVFKEGERIRTENELTV